MHAALQRSWLRRGPLAWLLAPVALLYGLVTALRRPLYRHEWIRTTRLRVPVVVVGNVVAGGAGKTPAVIEIVAHLRRRGVRAGVISRGYGRRSSDCIEVHPVSDPAAAGDEPLLIARRTGSPVFVARRRADAARALLHAYPQTQVIVSDDGLQHLALARDIDICVFDERGVGNGWLLPAGPLREPWPRHVDLVLDASNSHRRLAAQAVRADGATRPLHMLRGRPVHAVAAIANPEVFFRMLAEAGLTPASCIALPDHDDFASVSFDRDATLVCTEKDAAKLWRTRPDAWAVPLELNIDASFWDAFDRLLDAKLSSTDGPQTA